MALRIKDDAALLAEKTKALQGTTGRQRCRCAVGANPLRHQCVYTTAAQAQLAAAPQTAQQTPGSVPSFQPLKAGGPSGSGAPAQAPVPPSFGVTAVEAVDSVSVCCFWLWFTPYFACSHRLVRGCNVLLVSRFNLHIVAHTR